MRSSILALTALTAVVLSSGCRATIPEGRFGCSLDSECPPGQSCMSGLCRSAPVADGGMPGDASTCDDGVFCNGFETMVGGSCVDGTPPCAPEECDEELDQCAGAVVVRFVHAAYRLGVTTFTVGPTSVALSYGEVSAPVVIPEPSTSTLPVSATTSGNEITGEVDVAPSLIIVLGPEGADGGERFYALTDVFPAGSSSPVFRLQHVMGARGQIALGEPSSAGPQILALGQAGAERTTSTMVGGQYLLNVRINDVAADVPLEEELAGFTASIDRNAWALLMGDLRRHPSDPLGPAMLVLDETPEMVRPDPLVHVLNATSDTSEVWMCVLSGDVAIAAVSLEWGLIWPGLTLSPVDPLTLGFGPTEESACDGTNSTTVVRSDDLEPETRHLIVVSGAGSTVTLVPEPAFDGLDHSGDTQVAFGHFAPGSTPSSIDVRLADGVPATIFSAVQPNELYFSPVERGHLQGAVEIISGGNPVSSFILDETDTTDVLYLLYADSGAGAITRTVIAPYGGSWLAGMR